MSAPDNIRQLVDLFEEQRDAYHKGKYNETQLRADFLNPLFEALGWDVLNHKGHAEKYREVILEASVEVKSMLAMHKQAASARLPQEKEMLQRQVQATDEQIDRLVYELYGLTEEEIKIVEGD